MMQTVLKKELVIDNSHSFLLSDLPFKTGEKVVFFCDERDGFNGEVTEMANII